MGKLKLYDINTPVEDIVREREATYGKYSTLQKIEHLFELIFLSIKMNQGKPLKMPQKKGLLLYRKNHH